jgi:hypothetical protein
MSIIARQLESVTLKFISSVAVGNWCITISVAFFILEVGGGILKQISKYFIILSMFLIEDYWKHQSVRFLHGKSLSKTFPSSRNHSSSSSPPKYWSKTTLGSSPMQNPSCSMPSSSFSAQDSGLKSQPLLSSLNVLTLYGNMKQLTKLHVSIFALPTRTDIVMTL